MRANDILYNVKYCTLFHAILWSLDVFQPWNELQWDPHRSLHSHGQEQAQSHTQLLKLFVYTSWPENKNNLSGKGGRYFCSCLLEKMWGMCHSCPEGTFNGRGRVYIAEVLLPAVQAQVTLITESTCNRIGLHSSLWSVVASYFPIPITVNLMILERGMGLEEKRVGEWNWERIGQGRKAK